MTNKITFFGKNFWDIWLQKIFRNFASMKFQWLLFLYIPVIYGMFNAPIESATEFVPYISASLGLTFLGGGFITLATSRIIARTKLTESNDSLDCDK